MAGFVLLSQLSLLGFWCGSEGRDRISQCSGAASFSADPHGFAPSFPRSSRSVPCPELQISPSFWVLALFSALMDAVLFCLVPAAASLSPPFLGHGESLPFPRG